MQGRILKGVGSFYTVQGENGAVVCKARGRFRKEGLVPVPGDWVDYDVGADENGYLLQIHPRRNLLTRPAVSNIDRLFIVLSASQPEMDLLLCDKLLLQCASRSIQPILVCNKCDDGPEESYIELAAQYKPAGYAVLPVSAKTGYGIPEIIKRMEGCVCCFAGQSAVGKSSLLNCILPDLTLEVGDLSRKTARGRHTTRHAELFPAFGGAVVDTPGFSLFDMAPMERALGTEEACEDFANKILTNQAKFNDYPEMAAVKQDCRFPGCLHITEPDCAVKPLLETGGLHPQRYARYKVFIEELKEMRKYRYD